MDLEVPEAAKNGFWHEALSQVIPKEASIKHKTAYFNKSSSAELAHNLDTALPGSNYCTSTKYNASHPARSLVMPIPILLQPNARPRP